MADEENDQNKRKELSDKFWDSIEEGSSQALGEAVLFLLDKMPLETLETVVQEYAEEGTEEWAIFYLTSHGVVKSGFQTEKEALKWINKRENRIHEVDQYVIEPYRVEPDGTINQ